MSKLVKDQSKQIRADYFNGGEPETLIVTIRFDDRCGNGHNTFSITGELYRAPPVRGERTVKHESGKTLWCHSGGCIHDEIAKHLPQLAKFIKWHLCSTDGPMHYVANTIFLAGDRDHNKLRKGEFRQLIDRETKLPLWKLDDSGWKQRTVAAAEKPEPVVMQWVPWGTEGEGKERELDKARKAAIWPDATDEELMADDLAAKLTARLPALMVEFQAAVEELGFTY